MNFPIKTLKFYGKSLKHFLISRTPFNRQPTYIIIEAVRIMENIQQLQLIISQQNGTQQTII